MGEEHVVRRALWWSVGCAVLFTAFAAGTRRLRAHSPWQEDPYDVVVSFTELLVPALAVALVARIAGRRPQPPLTDLLRGGRALVGMVAVTAVTDGVAVALRVHAGAWGGTGRLLIAALAVVTLAAATAAAALRRATRRTGDRAPPSHRRRAHRTGPMTYWTALVTWPGSAARPGGRRLAHCAGCAGWS